MPTTTNYGWTTPADTDLVKDGASAIRTLGSSIDTTTKNLNPSTTLGDIEYRSSTTNTNTRLAIGSTGEVLTVAAGVPSWAALPAGGGMTLINTGGTTLTGSSITISSIPSTYKNLQLIVRDWYSSHDGALLAIRFNSDSGANYAELASFAATVTAGGTNVSIANEQDNASSDAIVRLDVPDYANSTTWKIFDYISISNNKTTPTTTVNSMNRQGVWFSTSAISSITLLPDQGTFSGGTAFLYGVN
jgi:hypothetical protein